jgi:hypothetical protein
MAEWFHLAQERDQWREFFENDIKPLCPIKYWIILE